jgi:hypothetical protein
MGMPVPLKKFVMLCAKDGIQRSSFTTNQLAKIAGQEYTVIHSWFEARILIADGEDNKPRERRSSFSTAFAAGVCGALRRQGVSLAALKATADLIRAVGKPQIVVDERVTA